MRSNDNNTVLVWNSKPNAVLSLFLSLSTIQSNPAGCQRKMANGDKMPTEKEALLLDPKSLEAIIDGVAAKLREECTRKPGEHSGSMTASSSGGNRGECLGVDSYKRGPTAEVATVLRDHTKGCRGPSRCHRVQRPYKQNAQAEQRQAVAHISLIG